MNNTLLAPSPPVLGSVEPRIWTPALREFTPKSSYGFDVIDFAEYIGRPLDPWQRWLVVHAGELLDDGVTPRFRQVLILMARQNGKALDVDTPILTTAGWRTMGELKAGDEVYHPSGSPTRVTGAFGVIEGHDCYRVTTSDGRSIIADADHLWTVIDKTSAWSETTITTRDLLNRGLQRSHRSNGRNEYRFALPEQYAIKTPDVALPLDPYLFGAWLGDGNSLGSSLAVGDEDYDAMTAQVIASGARVVTAVRERTAWRVSFNIGAPMRDGFQSRCMRMGVWGQKSIPKRYLTAGTAQRLALLQGLLDTDGSISSPQGQVEFCSMNRNLADGVLYLIRSLGWRATMCEGIASVNGRGCGAKYRVSFTPVGTDHFVPFRLQRKADRIRPTDGGAGRHTVSIARIEPVESRPVRCIKVESVDGLYLAGRDLIPTHNTELLVVLALYWMYVERTRLILGTSTNLDYARESWEKAVSLAEGNDRLARDIHPKSGVRRANGEQTLTISTGGRYKIAASNSRGGRSLTIDRLVMDELREHHDWSAYNAAKPATAAVPDAQIWMISNQGDDRSVVLSSLRAQALAETDPRLGLFEWSAPDGASATDVQALAAANPNLGRRISLDSLIGDAMRAEAAGGEQLAGFLTEHQCRYVPMLNPVVDPASWLACLDAGDLAAVREKVTLCMDVAPDLQHATLYAAASLDDGRVRVEPVRAWAGPGCTDTLRSELSGLVTRVKPVKFGWFPAGPAAALAADMAERRGWPPDGVALEEIRGDVTAVCMGFSEQVGSKRIAHSGDPLLDAHVAGAEKLSHGDGWRFSRKGGGHVDAVYAAAGAVHLARTLQDKQAFSIYVPGRA